MMKNKSLFLLALLPIVLEACSSPLPIVDSTSKESSLISPSSAESSKVNEEVYEIYKLYKANGGELTYEEWLSSVKGEKGDPGEKGEKGEAGVSIIAIEKTGNNGLVDIYTITLSNGNTTTFTVTNGAGGSSTENEQGFVFYLQEDGTYYVGAGQSGFLKTLVIPSSYKGKPVTGIMDYGFYASHWSEYSDIVSSSSRGFGYETIILPDTIKYIGKSAFRCCNSLVSINLPKGITSIGSDAFSYCSSLTSIEIPSSVVTIGDGAFSGCSSLESAIISNGVSFIGSGAFSSCYSLGNVVIPSSVGFIGEYAFSNCSLIIFSELQSIPPEWSDTWNGSCQVVYGITGYLTSSDVCYAIVGFESERSLIPISVGGEPKDIAIPEEVEGLPVSAVPGNLWKYCAKTLETIVIPDGVTIVGDLSFRLCFHLKSVVFGNGITSIGSYAFFSCPSLTSIAITDSVKSIGANAFQTGHTLVINYSGSKEQWNSLQESNSDIGLLSGSTIHCTDGDIVIK